MADPLTRTPGLGLAGRKGRATPRGGAPRAAGRVLPLPPAGPAIERVDHSLAREIDHGIHAGHGSLPFAGSGRVRLDDGDSRIAPRVTAGPGHHSALVAAVEHGTDEMPADKTGGSGKKDVHPGGERTAWGVRGRGSPSPLPQFPPPLVFWRPP